MAAFNKIILLLAVMAAFLAPMTSKSAPPPPTPSATPNLPPVTWDAPDGVFLVGGQPRFLFSRNLAAYNMVDFNNLLLMTRNGGSRLARIQVCTYTAGSMGYTADGTIDEAWTVQWEKVFATAQKRGVYVWITFTAWFDWNTTNYNTWGKSPLNKANGGPAASPHDLFVADSATQKIWLKWLTQVVARWQKYPNILIWEPFSELNLAQNVTQAEAVNFAQKTSAAIRAADPARRPIHYSLADMGVWGNLYRSPAIDILAIHPYPPSGQLDREIITDVRSLLDAYHKPVMIGESGLSAETPDVWEGRLTRAQNASRGLGHAMWAGLVSGALNGRALWWEDGYGIYFPKLSWNFLRQNTDIEKPAAAFARDLVFKGFKPIPISFERAPLLWGAALGNENTIIAWLRDAACEPPDWPLRPISGQKVSLRIPNTHPARWKVDFYDTKAENKLIGSVIAESINGQIQIPLPAFQDDIAMKLTIQQSR